MRIRRKKEVLGESELNITPLIDCIFLLLIFFMVTTVFIDVKGLQVDLPGESDAQEEEQQKKDINIQISISGEYSVSGESVSASELPMAISGAMQENNNKNVIIYGDPEAQLGYIVYAMDMAQGQGATGMAFAVEQSE